MKTLLSWLLCVALIFPTLALGQALGPNRVTATTQIHLNTNLNVEMVTANGLDAGYVYTPGDVTALGRLVVDGGVVLNAAVNVLGAATVGGALGVTGASTLTGDVGISGHTNMQDAGAFNIVAGGALSVTGGSTLTGHTTAGDGGVYNLVVNGTLGVTGTATLASLGASGWADGGTVPTEYGIAFLSPDNTALPAWLYPPTGSNPALPGYLQLCASEWCSESLFLDGAGTGYSYLTDSNGVDLQISGQPKLRATASLVEIITDGGVALNFYVLGDSTVGGTFGVTGDTSLGYVLAGDAGVSNVVASGTLGVTGDSTLGYILAGDAGVRNVAASGTLNVTGDSTLGYVLAADAGANNIIATGALGVTGATTLGYVLGADAGFNAIIATGGIKPAATGKSITFYNSTTHAALDLASVNANVCSAQETETISGAALGDSCHVAAGTELEAGTIFACSVTAANTAKWQLCNMAGAPVNRASDTYYISVLRGEP